MENKRIEIDHQVKGRLDALMAERQLKIDELLNTLLDEHERYRRELEEMTAAYQLQKKIRLDSFIIGDAISDGICVVNRHGVVTAINKGYTKITGLREKQVVGQHIQALLDKKYFNNAVSLKVLEQKKKVSAMSVIAKNNKQVLIVGNPFFDEQGEVIQVLTVMRDLTELVSLKEKLEEAERKEQKYLHELKFLKENQIGSDLIGTSHAMQKIKQLIEQVAKTDATILITGETGVGKEVVAKELHKKSRRKEGPYIKINCAAIPETLLESELFGYEKGAFTGARKTEKLGMFELANRGTILLDEIGEMPLKLQSKLLRVLQEKEITRVGGTRSINLDVRVLAATNQNLQEQIQQGTFREDLYYRLNVIPIQIPPLRERVEDIELFAHYFLEKFSKKYNKEMGLERESLKLLKEYTWPGNVREIENTIERAVVTNNGKLISRSSIFDVLEKGRSSVELNDYQALTLREAVDRLEKELIEKALKKHKSTYRAADALGITQSTVFRKAKALGIDHW